MSLRSLKGKHCTTIFPPRPAIDGSPLNDLRLLGNGTCTQTTRSTKLIVWSAADRGGINRIKEQNSNLHDIASLQTLGWESWSGNLAYTLDSHRTHLPWRSYALLRSPSELVKLDSHMSSPVRVDADRSPRVGFVFSGQGAQWAGMGRELLDYSIFREHLETAERFLKDLGCRWSVIGAYMCLVSYPEFC